MARLNLSEVWIYPVKSLGGISLKNGEVQGKGLRFDRRWMIIDQDGIAMTQRVYPEMALFKVRLADGGISIDFKKGGKVISSSGFNAAKPSSGHAVEAKVWGDTVTVHEVDTTLSKWFSHLLKTSCRLVAFPEENTRPADPRYAVKQEHVSLADAWPFLIIGQASLDDLNKRLALPVPVNRFRPNFVFTGGEPFMEDEWRHISIGKLRFLAVKKCVRCALPTVDQDTAERASEPLKTLSAFRKVGHEVFFGQNLVALDYGTVCVGDPIIPG